MQVSQRAVGKIIQVFDHLLQRNEKVSKAIRGEKEVTEQEPDSSAENGETKVRFTIEMILSHF